MEITSLDLRYLMKEFEELGDGFVQKAYQRGQDFTLEFYTGEKQRLVVKPNAVFLSQYKRDNPERPPGFCMELRKHLGGVDRIRQRGFDRILEIRSGDVRFVAELFGKGNAALVKDGKTIGALRQEEWSDRRTVVGEEFGYPEPAPNPYDMESCVQNLESGELVRRLAKDLSLGGTYAEEVCERAEVDKHIEVSDMDGRQESLVEEALAEVLELGDDPVLYTDPEGEPVRAAPFPLQTYSEHEEERFETFSRALDELFHRRRQQKLESKRMDKYRERREGIERQLHQQKQKAEGLEQAARQRRQAAETIYENYQVFHDLKQEVDSVIREEGWESAEQLEVSNLESVNHQERFYRVAIDGAEVKLSPDESLEAAASRMYDEAKEREQKAENAREALQNTRGKLEELEEDEFEVEEDSMERDESRSKRWFEKYRWFHTPEGRLVICGRGPQTNESLVKEPLGGRRSVPPRRLRRRPQCRPERRTRRFRGRDTTGREGSGDLLEGLEVGNRSRRRLLRGTQSGDEEPRERRIPGKRSLRNPWRPHVPPERVRRCRRRPTRNRRGRIRTCLWA
jgi:Predicted RNA-binding protein homologous to eukaryotic snRNP